VGLWSKYALPKESSGGLVSGELGIADAFIAWSDSAKGCEAVKVLAAKIASDERITDV